MMTTGAIIFWALSWSFVLGLAGWSFGTILSRPRHFDPDGIGPDVPAQPGASEERGGKR